MSNSLLRTLRYAFGSLKLRTALTGILLIGVSVALTVFLVLRNVEHRTERAVLDAQLGDAERLARVLSSRVVSLQNSLRAAASRVPVAKLDNPQAVSTFLQNSVVLQTLFDSTFVTTIDGRMLALADANGVRTPNINNADRAYFKKTLALSRPVVSEPVLGRDTGEPIIVMTMPVLNPQGRIAAVLGSSLRLTQRALMGELTRSGNNEYDPVTTIITDASGRIISHPDKQWIMRDAITEPRIAAAAQQWIAEGRPVEPQGSAHRVDGFIVAIAGVPDADWMVFRTSSAEVLLGGPSAGAREALWVGAAVALAGGAILLLATLFMLRPLGQLERRAMRLLDDDMAAEEGWPHTGGELGGLSKVFIHVMRERAASRQASEALLAKMLAVMGSAPVGIAFTQADRFDLVSAQFSRMFGYEVDQLVGQPTHLICVSQEEHQATGKRVEETFADGRVFDEEVELVRADGSRFWGRRRGAPVSADKLTAGAIWIVTDVTESRKQQAQLSWTAAHDPLTNLPNRREFERQLGELLHERRETGPASALFLDLDHFKAVNDTAGHAAGDEVLKDIAKIIAQRVRTKDTPARLGGDEFAALLRGCDGATATRVAEQIRARIEAYRLTWKGASFQVGASIGVVEINDSFSDAAAVMQAADAACYDAKRAGRNAVHRHSPKAAMAPSEVTAE